jgi:hypothetical protein
MPLSRDIGPVTALFAGVHFTMADKRRKKVSCFLTRAGFAALAGDEHLSRQELRDLFVLNREAIERLANSLYECPAAEV